MNTTVRRLCLLALLGGAGYAGWLAWQSRRDDGPGEAVWPPFDDQDAAQAADAVGALATDSEEIAEAVPTAGDATWVEPVDGACPDGYPVKANDNSGIYHVPGGRFYERTVPERCYVDAQAAEADGYRAAKA